MNVEAEATTAAANSSSLKSMKAKLPEHKALFDLAFKLGFCDGIFKCTEEFSDRIIDIKEKILFRSGLRDLK